MHAEPSYSIHFHFAFAPKDHDANMYGFKSESSMQTVLSNLEKNPEVTKLFWTKQWKVTKMSRWMREEHKVR